MATEVASQYSKFYFPSQVSECCVTVTAFCLQTAAVGQTTYAASQSANQFLAPFNYYLLFYGFFMKYSAKLNPERHVQPLLPNLALVKLHKQVHNLKIFQHNLWLLGCEFWEQYNRK